MLVGAIAYAKWQAAKQPPVPVGHTLAGLAGVLLAIGAVLWMGRGFPRWVKRDQGKISHQPPREGMRRIVAAPGKGRAVSYHHVRICGIGWGGIADR